MDFYVAMMNSVAGDQLAICVDFIDVIVKVISGLQERSFAGFNIMANLKPEVPWICLPEKGKKGHPMILCFSAFNFDNLCK
jgi:hypothetical protein